MVSSSGTKYEALMWMLSVAAVSESRYMSCMDSLPPLGEPMNICAVWPPVASSGGK